MSEKYFENTSSQNDINFLKCELQDTISKVEKISYERENMLRKERELKLRIDEVENRR